MTQLISIDRARAAIPAMEPDADHIIEPLVEAASAAIERYCNRVFASTSHSEFRDGDGSSIVMMDNFPITAVSRVSAYPTAALQVWNTDDTTNSRASVAVTSTGLTLVRVASGVMTTSTLTFAAYPTIVAMQGAINALAAGWAAVVVTGWSSWASADLLEQGARPCLAAYADCELMGAEITCTGVEDGAGHIRLAESISSGSRNILVEYTAGFATVPADVQLACATMVSNAYHALERDGGLRTERLGDYAFAAQDDAIFTPQVRRLLGPYRDFVV